VVSDSEGPASSRRALLRVGGTAAAASIAAGLAACGSKGSAHTSTGPPPSPPEQVDIQLLNAGLDREYKAIALYTAAVPLLKGRAHTAAKLFLEQELAHASTLMGYIAQAGGKPHKQRSSYDFGNPRGLRGLFRVIVMLEDQQIVGYLNAVTQLSTPQMRAAVAAVLANDAQHLSVAKLLLNENPVPTGFVTGQA
jgi:bacterioferritin (cytochrome b1)